MEISFKWVNNPPDHPSAEVIQGGLQFALDHFPDPRGIREKVATAHISLDAFKLNVVGVGWSENDGERLVVFNYDINRGASTCVDYKSP